MPKPKIPTFTLPSTSGAQFNLADIEGKALVVYFYPKDNTPGCTTEALDFREHYKAFRAAGADVVGISRDSLKSHLGFKTKMALPFDSRNEEKRLLKLLKISYFAGD